MSGVWGDCSHRVCWQKRAIDVCLLVLSSLFHFAQSRIPCLGSDTTHSGGSSHLNVSKLIPHRYACQLPGLLSPFTETAFSVDSRLCQDDN